MRKKCTINWIQTLFLVIFLLLSSPLAARELINLGGYVRSSEGAPLSGVAIKLDGLKVVGKTNESGSFEIQVPEICMLNFSLQGYSSQSISIRGKNLIMVSLEKEITGPNKMIVREVRDQLIGTPAKLEVDHRYLKLNTRFKIPEKIFNNYTRLIIQPYVVRFSDPELLYMLSPVVYDGRDYSIRQSRMYGNARLDPLYEYIVPASSVREGYIPYADSLRVDSLDFDFYTYSKVFVETCCDVVHKDTVLVSKGIVNPMKFFGNRLGPVWDKDNAPKDSIGPREESGNMDVRFEINKYVINDNLGNNKAELGKIQSKLRMIDEAARLTIDKLVLKSTASPDGIYAKNLALSKQRMEASMNYLISKLTPETRKTMKKSTVGEVATWKEVADL
ncbi:MAG: hypothetical protein ACRC9Q_01855, partial [Bacteroidales bacterium]